MRYQHRSSVETTSVGDRVVLYDTAEGKAIVLNATGAWLWSQLAAPCSPDELSQRLGQRFPVVESSQIKQDVDACLRSLLEQNLLREEA